MFWCVEYLRKQHWMFGQIKSKLLEIGFCKKLLAPDTLGDGTLSW